MNYTHIDLKGDLSYILSHMDKALATLVSNLESLTEEEIRARQDFIECSRAYKKNHAENYIRVLLGEEKDGEGKKIATTAAEKMAKALSTETEIQMDQARGILEGVVSRKQLEVEKINVCKKLIDSRTHVGG